MRSLSYVQAKTVREAIEAYAAAGEGARYIAGGTTLYDLMKLGVERPAHLVDIASLEGADRIDTSGDVLFFGAGALMADVAENEVVRRDYPVLAESLSKAASQQLRNMAAADPLSLFQERRNRRLSLQQARAGFGMRRDRWG